MWEHCHLTEKIYYQIIYLNYDLKIRLKNIWRKLYISYLGYQSSFPKLFMNEWAEIYEQIDVISNADEKYINYTVNSGYGL